MKDLPTRLWKKPNYFNVLLRQSIYVKIKLDFQVFVTRDECAQSSFLPIFISFDSSAIAALQINSCRNHVEMKWKATIGSHYPESFRRGTLSLHFLFILTESSVVSPLPVSSSLPRHSPWIHSFSPHSHARHFRAQFLPKQIKGFIPSMRISVWNRRKSWSLQWRLRDPLAGLAAVL